MIAIVFLYVDPGSGSYLIQVIIAAILGALFYFKTVWWKIKNFFHRPKKDESAKNDNLNG